MTINTNHTTKNVLIIKSSPALAASVSNEIADYLIQQLEDKNESYEFTIRDLAKTPAPIYDNDILQAFYSPQDQLTEQQKNIAAPSLEYIQELKDADIIVFASPMHNFSVTTLLKSYIDQICRIGITFQYSEAGAEGLIKDKQAIIISSAGGDFQQEQEKHKDFQTPYLTHILNFIGIENVEVVPVQGVGYGDEAANHAKEKAKQSLNIITEQVL
jgi:FMN-dependent NADH-azoreductase